MLVAFYTRNVGIFFKVLVSSYEKFKYNLTASDNGDKDIYIETNRKILLLTVRSPLFLTLHFKIAVSSTSEVTFLALISSKYGFPLVTFSPNE